MQEPPAKLFEQPTQEQKAAAEVFWKEYRPIYLDGKLIYWKLYHKKTKKDCGCG